MWLAEGMGSIGGYRLASQASLKIRYWTVKLLGWAWSTRSAGPQGTGPQSAAHAGWVGSHVGVPGA